jgi:hypothetical protein
MTGRKMGSNTWEWWGRLGCPVFDGRQGSVGRATLSNDTNLLEVVRLPCWWEQDARDLQVETKMRLPTCRVLPGCAPA